MTVAQEKFLKQLVDAEEEVARTANILTEEDDYDTYEEQVFDQAGLTQREKQLVRQVFSERKPTRSAPILSETQAALQKIREVI